MINFQICPISEEYIAGYNAAVDSVAKERKYLGFLEGPPIKSSQEFVLNNLKYGWPHFVAICNKEVVGWCDISSLDRPIFEHAGVLGIGIIASYRGKGIGKALLRAAIEKAKLKGLTRIELTVRENNKNAIALYEQLGFKIEGLHRNAVRIANVYENLISMALLIDE